MHESNLQEVEIRARLDIVKLQEIKVKIEAMSGELEGVEEITDNYWCKESAKDFEDIRMDDVGTFSLRTRKRNKNGNLTMDLNIKIITTHGDHNAWDEHETSVGNLEETETILRGIGYKNFFNLTKKRETYKLLDFTIVLEEIDNYGLVVEFEKMLAKSEAEEGKKSILEFMMKEFRIGDGSIIPKTPVNEMMQRMGRF